MDKFTSTSALSQHDLNQHMTNAARKVAACLIVGLIFLGQVLEAEQPPVPPKPKEKPLFFEEASPSTPSVDLPPTPGSKPEQFRSFKNLKGTWTLDMTDRPSQARPQTTKQADRSSAEPHQEPIHAPYTKPKAKPTNFAQIVKRAKAQNKTKQVAKSKGTQDSPPKSLSAKQGGRKAAPFQAHNANLAACRQALARYDIAYTPLSDFQNKRGCELKTAVEVTRIQGVRIKPSAKLNCDMVVRTAKWLDRSQSSAAQHFAARIDTLHHMSAYSCRFRSSGKMSEHGAGNALDIGGVTLSNGLKTTVLKDWYSDHSPEGTAKSRFWYDVAGHGCDAYRLVLSPVSNAAHKNHLHFDAGHWKLCER